MASIAYLIFSESCSFLRVTRTSLKSRISCKFGQIVLYTEVLADHVCLKITFSDVATLCLHFMEILAYLVLKITFTVLECNKGNHKILDEFELQQNRTTDSELAVLCICIALLIVYIL